ncbi:Protein of unknown function, partial [Gryllus bimaculatus]
MKDIYNNNSFTPEDTVSQLQAFSCEGRFQRQCTCQQISLKGSSSAMDTEMKPKEKNCENIQSLPPRTENCLKEDPATPGIVCNFPPLPQPFPPCSRPPASSSSSSCIPSSDADLQQADVDTI